jgi:transcriptional regulator with XRE-family HTH domain
LDRGQISRIESNKAISSFDNIALLSYALGKNNMEEVFKAFAHGIALKEKEGTIPLSYEALSKPNLGAWLKYRRQAQGLNMMELAAKAGLNHATISRLESEAGDQKSNGFIENPGTEVIAALAKALNVSVYEPFLVISKKYMRSNLDMFPEDIDKAHDPSIPDADLSFPARVQRIEKRRAIELRTDPAVRAADEFESFLLDLDKQKHSPRMLLPSDGQVYQEVLEHIDSPDFSNALTSPSARQIVESYLKGDLTAQAQRERKHGKEFNTFIGNLKARGENPHIPMQLVDGEHLYQIVTLNAHKPRFQEELDPDALMIAKTFLKHLELGRTIFPTLTKRERDQVKDVTNRIFSNADLSNPEKVGALFNSFVVQLTQDGLRPQMVPQPINHQVYFRLYNCIEKPEFERALTDPAAIELRKKYIEKLKLLQVLHGQ